MLAALMWVTQRLGGDPAQWIGQQSIVDLNLRHQIDPRSRRVDAVDRRLAGHDDFRGSLGKEIHDTWATRLEDRTEDTGKDVELMNQRSNVANDKLDQLAVGVAVLSIRSATSPKR